MASKLTMFGRFTRKIRLEHDELLKDMAKHLGVSPAFLSAVERGQRNAPLDWVVVLQKAYNLNDDMTASLREALEESRVYIKLDVSHLPIADRRLIAELVERFPSIRNEGREAIRHLLDETSTS